MINVSKRIVFLDYMRIFAFITVLVGHKFYPWVGAVAADPSAHATIRLIANLTLPLFLGGAAGVVVFFLTSGYIITHVLQKEAPLEFLIKRIFRIYPLYVFAVLLEVVMDNMIKGLPVPSIAIMLPRMLLIGDFFDTPYALGDVEWTLRIEVLFYLLMALLGKIGLLRGAAQKVLPFLYVALAVALAKAPVIPDFPGSGFGYVNIYSPFLLIGSLIYLLELRSSGRASFWMAIGALMITFFLVIAALRPDWKDSHYAVSAVLIFLAGWFWRDGFAAGPIVRLLSDLTYAVYLFHNWLWAYLKQLLTPVTVLPEPLQIVIVLFALCYLFHRLVEKPGVALGRYVSRSLRRRRREESAKEIVRATP